jgi:hypothetical protein
MEAAGVIRPLPEAAEGTGCPPSIPRQLPSNRHSDSRRAGLHHVFRASGAPWVRIGVNETSDGNMAGGSSIPPALSPFPAFTAFAAMAGRGVRS